jgi:glyoxylase-like metal-dependent hydrolase (beta-lactamase superfamily II)
MMEECMNRREFLKTGVLSFVYAAVAGASGGIALAGQSPARPGQQQAGYYRLRIGDVDVIALSDGTVPINAALLDAKPEHIGALLKASRATSPLDASVNAFLIVKGTRLILVDAGTGDLLGPTLNKLPAGLAAAGYKPEQITDILLTHIHSDHTGGLVVRNKPVFPNATIHLERKEAEYWLNPDNKAAANTHHKHMFDQAQNSVGPYAAAGKLRYFDGAEALFPGISSFPAPGHTPGHSFYILESKGEKLVFWGDTIHIAEVQFPEPGVTIQYDTAPEAAAKQRKLALAKAEQEGYLVAAAHISFPGVGRVVAANPGYRWIPVTYVNDAPTTDK